MFKGLARLPSRSIRLALRPLVRAYCWWFPVPIGKRGHAVVLPDSMAIFMVCVAIGLLAPFAWEQWRFALAFLSLAPAIFTEVVWITPGQVRVIRLFALLPYWVHEIPEDARFDLYESFDDVAPTGVAFESAAYGADPLHLGTAATALPLYHHLSLLLKESGWHQGLGGMTRKAPSAL
jgi:hypothetical protein